LKKLLFFPTPYPDEILYSVLCRYHIRCGIPSPRQTNLELWGNIYGKRLLLPDGIERISAQIPASAYLSAERLIKDNVIYPLLKPFLSISKCEELMEAMIYGNSNIYNIIGFPKVFTLQHQSLRYCSQCIESDTKSYGEPYWHRIHQLPVAYICPIHGVATTESKVMLDELRSDFFLPTPVTDDIVLSFEPIIAKKLLEYARDASWLLQHGFGLQCFEYTAELYDNRLRIKGYRDHNGKTSSKRLAQDIVGYYGSEYLALFDAYNSGACPWVKRVIQDNQSFRHPLYHMLLMRFLSGSVEAFFMDALGKRPEYHPFGAPPYPCRNYICEHHLQDVIERIEIRKFHATPHATFICPYCGFTYNRRGNVLKEKHYAGNVRIVAYGWKWEEKVTALLVEDKSPYKIAREVHCDVRTVISFGIERGVLPPERFMGRGHYSPIGSPIKKPDFETKRTQYRQRWLDTIATNPLAARNELRILDSKADQWLHLHDTEWLEQNSPTSKKAIPSWAGCDDEYLERVKNAVDQIRNYAGKPKRISITSIGKIAGIHKPHKKFTSDHIPKTKSFVAANTDTLEHWQKRKILWAIQQLRDNGEVVTLFKVKYTAAIADSAGKLNDFITGLL